MPWWDPALGDYEDKMNKATSESAPSTQQHWGGICRLARTDLVLIPAPTFSEPQLSSPIAMEMINHGSPRDSAQKSMTMCT